jgi:hypothetical protein
MPYPTIEVFVTSQNFALFDKCKKRFPWNVRRISGNKGFYGIKSLLFAIEKCESEMIVMLDEDAFVANVRKIEQLFVYLWDSNYACCGVRDGGIINHRLHNPLVPNLFFCILKTKQIQSEFSRQAILDNQHLKNIEQPKLDLPFVYKYDLYEPYYCLFFWLLRMGMKIYYLNDVQNGIPTLEDELTSVVSYDRVPIIYHSWFAREYQKNFSQTKRIDKLLNYINDRDRSMMML